MNAHRTVILSLSLLVPAVLCAEEFSPKMRQAALADEKAYTLDKSSVRIEKLGLATAPLPADTKPEESMVIPIVLIGRIVDLGAKLWTIVDKIGNAKDKIAPEDIKTLYATATPAGVSRWSQMQGWTPPQGPIYGFSAKNLYGMTVVKARYQVLRSYNGSYNNQGKYLAAVSVQPSDVEVSLPGYRVKISVEIPEQNLLNAGTVENPVAAMTVIVKWAISSPIKGMEARAVYYLTRRHGNGGRHSTEQGGTEPASDLGA